MNSGQSVTNGPSSKLGARERHPLATRLSFALGQLAYLPRTVTLVWEAARPWTVAWSALLLVQGGLPVVSVALTRALVDSLVSVTQSPGEASNVQSTLLLVAATAGVVLLSQVLRSTAEWVRTAQSERVQDYILDMIHRKATTIDFAFYESATYHDKMYRAQSEARYRPVTLLENLGGLVQNGITLLAMGAVLLTFGPWVPVALVLSAVPALLAVMRDSLRQHRWTRRSTSAERRAHHYDRLLTRIDAAAELRLFDLGDHFRHLYQRIRAYLRGERLRLAKQRSLESLAAGMIGLLITSAVMAWMVFRTYQGAFSLGDLALLYQALNQGQGLMRTLLENAGRIYSNSLFLGDLFGFLELESRILSPTHPLPMPGSLQEGIRFEGVVFRYPGSSREVLQGFDLFLPANRITAIVGSNGAGKSTLVKLLCRLYDPQGGRITLDGHDLADFDLEQLRRGITVLFQEPTRYFGTVADSIALGDLAVKGRDRVEAAARAAAADEVAASLPNGYDTLLGKWLADGTELSLGQWQRLALARAFYRQAPILILDEPTSAMDSWSEADWLIRFRDLAAGQTAMLITHRFTTAMYADIIHVMDRGRILQSGTHEELLALGGRYAQSWRQQMSGVRLTSSGPS
jgi:ATP-binding cassette subfamily B protein